MVANPIIDDVMKEIGQWGDSTFGSAEYRALGILHHIEEELEELLASPLDLEEVADLVVLTANIVWQNQTQTHARPLSAYFGGPCPLGLDSYIVFRGLKWSNNGTNWVSDWGNRGNVQIGKIQQMQEMVQEMRKDIAAYGFVAQPSLCQFLACICEYVWLVRHLGPSDQPFFSAILQKKMEKNYLRQWQKPDSNGVIRHVGGIQD